MEQLSCVFGLQNADRMCGWNVESWRAEHVLVEIMYDCSAAVISVGELLRILRIM